MYSVCIRSGFYAQCAYLTVPSSYLTMYKGLRFPKHWNFLSRMGVGTYLNPILGLDWAPPVLAEPAELSSGM